MATAKIGLVAFSFGLLPVEQEPNRANVHLADAIEELIGFNWDEYILVAQWEIAHALARYSIFPELVVHLNADGSYLDSEGVWRAACTVFKDNGVTDVVPIGQPFLQMHKLVKMIEADGFAVSRVRLRHIGFVPTSTQWWTRSWLQLLIYAVLQKAFGYRGHHGRQAAI